MDLEQRVQTLQNLVNVLVAQNGVMMAQNNIIFNHTGILIHSQRRIILDLNALNQSITDLGTNVDTLAADTHTAIGAIETANTNLQSALNDANTHLQTLVNNGRPEDQATIQQLQAALAAAGSVDLTGPVTSLQAINGRLSGLDSDIKSATKTDTPPVDGSGSGGITTATTGS